MRSWSFPADVRCDDKQLGRSGLMVTVLDGARQPLPGATVSLSNRGGRLSTCTTDESGHCVLNVAKDTHGFVAEVKLAGFSDVSLENIPHKYGCITDVRLELPLADNCEYVRTKDGIVALCE